MTKTIVGQLNEPDPRWWDDLVNINCRVLVIGGGGESHVDQRQLVATAARIKHGEYVLLGGGHHVHRARLDSFLHAVRSFLQA